MRSARIVTERAAPTSLRLLGPLFVAMFFGFLAVGLPLPVIAVYVHRSLGYGEGIAGLAVGIQSFATVLTRPAAGRMVDRDGAKLTLLRGLVVSGGAGVAYLVSAGWAGTPAASLAALVAGRLILGAGESLLVTGVLSWAVIRAGAGRSGRAMSWNGMAMYLSLATGAPIGFALYQAVGFTAVAWTATLLPVLAVAVVLPLSAAPVLGGGRVALLGVVGRIWKPGIGLMLAGVGFASVSTFATLDFIAQGWPGAGYALLAFGMSFVAVRLVAGDLPDRLGGRPVAACSLATEAVGQTLLWLAPGPATALLGAALTGAGCSLIFPAFGVEAVRRVAPESRGIAIGAFSAFQDLAIGLTGPLLGMLASVSGPAAPFGIGALLALAGVAASLSMLRPQVATL